MNEKKIRNDSEGHEEAAVKAMESNKTAEAQVHATLAVSKAINRIADSAPADGEDRPGA
ncbi:hypothetical protein [Amycolatopsis sp. NPDC004079]|uniref:Uncharacterized protein n=1 Tax=Amycolatopsis halotolerans TaxID=330083 RepID=A0ABV7QIZ2_9PSEU